MALPTTYLTTAKNLEGILNAILVSGIHAAVLGRLLGTSLTA